MLRFDIWLCLVLCMALAFGTGRLAERIAKGTYESYARSRAVASGEIGGAAGEDIFCAQSVEDLLAHARFTVRSPGIEYRNRGAGYFRNMYLYALTLPSGERVAAAINTENVQNSGDDMFTGEATLPVGRVVYADLTENENFLSQIEHGEPLSRHDFYVDMLGAGGTMAEEDYLERPRLLTQIATVLLCFPLLHALGARMGLFPYFFAPKKKKPQKESDTPWEA